MVTSFKIWVLPKQVDSVTPIIIKNIFSNIVLYFGRLWINGGIWNIRNRQIYYTYFVIKNFMYEPVDDDLHALIYIIKIHWPNCSLKFIQILSIINVYIFQYSYLAIVPIISLWHKTENTVSYNFELGMFTL